MRVRYLRQGVREGDAAMVAAVSDRAPCGLCDIGVYDQEALAAGWAYFKTGLEPIPECKSRPGTKCEGCVDFLARCLRGNLRRGRREATGGELPELFPEGSDCQNGHLKPKLRILPYH